MPSTRIFLSVLVAILALLPSPVLGQARTVDVRASVGYAYLLDEASIEAWVGGRKQTVPRGVHYASPGGRVVCDACSTVQPLSGWPKPVWCGLVGVRVLPWQGRQTVRRDGIWRYQLRNRADCRSLDLRAEVTKGTHRLGSSSYETRSPRWPDVRLFRPACLVAPEAADRAWSLFRSTVALERYAF